jgi:DtxR family Mn-dependent transcriptional regulator
MMTNNESREREISATAEDYVKAVWSATEWDGAPITTKGLAQRFGTTPATVSDTIKRLTAQGLMTHEPYREITLTKEGELHALRMVRRHRLIEAFLVTSLGYRWDEVHDEAENLEHSVSDLMVNRIDTLLGHPATDPHGDPIPDINGSIAYPSNAVRLTAAPAGRYSITRISDADPEQLTFFHLHGFLPGSTVVVHRPNDSQPAVRLSASEGHGVAIRMPATDAILLVPTR